MEQNKRSYISQYRKENIKRVALDMQLADYEELKSYVEEHGETVNGFIKASFREAMQRDIRNRATSEEIKNGPKKEARKIERALQKNGWTQSVVAREGEMAEYIKAYGDTVVGIEIALEPGSLNCYGYYGVGCVQIVKYETGFPYIRDDLRTMREYIESAECELLKIGVPFRPTYGFGRDLEYNLGRNDDLRRKYNLTIYEEKTNEV